MSCFSLLLKKPGRKCALSEQKGMEFYPIIKNVVMKRNSPEPYNDENRSKGDRSANDPARERMDIRDSKEDQEKLKPDEATIELPDVKDIPGQEFVNAPPLGMMADTTISSADEEGEGLFEDDEEDETDIVMGTEADIPESDRIALERGDDYMPTHDEELLQKASMDSRDFEGEKLNERSFGEERSGSDLDIPGRNEDIDRTSPEKSDEENKHYSLGSGDNDANENRS